MGSVQSRRLLNLYARANEHLLRHRSRRSSINIDQFVHKLSNLAMQYTLKAVNRGNKGFALNDKYNYDGTLTFPGNLTYDPCQLNYAEQYLNLKEVQDAMHVSRSSNALKWSSCNDHINEDWFVMDFISDVTTLYSDIYNHPSKPKHFKMLIYSGDSDGICATIGTQNWIYEIDNAEVMSLWQPWRVNDQQAGFVTQFYDSLTFATVHFAGHEVPAYQPERALLLLQLYLDDEIFTKSTSDQEAASPSKSSSEDILAVLISMAVILGVIFSLVVIARTLEHSAKTPYHSPDRTGSLYELVSRTQRRQRRSTNL